MTAGFGAAVFLTAGFLAAVLRTAVFLTVAFFLGGAVFLEFAGFFAGAFLMGLDFAFFAVAMAPPRGAGSVSTILAASAAQIKPFRCGSVACRGRACYFAHCLTR